MAITILWADGMIDEGPTPDALLELVASDPWNDCTADEVLALLSDRVWTLAGAALDPQLPVKEFFEGFEALGMCRILDWTNDPAVLPNSRRDRSLEF